MNRITLAHGSGGKLSYKIVKDLFLPEFNNVYLEPLNDQAVININKELLAFTTDSYVVEPIFFPGGNIGSLSVHGTINDLAMCGAKPLYLSAGFILEEEFSIDDLGKIISSMHEACKKDEVVIVTGDTKVVQKGKGDKIFINTSGIGIIQKPVNISAKNIKPGDAILISGTIADHGIAILIAREKLDFKTQIFSDTAPLWTLVETLLDCTTNIHCLRDPTRGGLATILNEIALSANVCIHIYEQNIPIKPEVKGACEILGLDPLYIPNEGRAVIILPEGEAEKVLEVLKKHPLGKGARIIGRVEESPEGVVLMKSRIGGTRILDMLTGELLPRIC
jgi:hydrogenase expression/formation protein HypE